MMAIGWQRQLRPGAELHKIVQEATVALIAMDADRLEDLARCCADLNRELHTSGQIAEAGAELQEAMNEVHLLGRILFETRANLTVFTRLRRIHLSKAMASETKQQNEFHLSGRTADYGNN